jgi:rhodanese-related sulfurtransferase
MLRRAQAANVVVYTVTLADPLDTEASPERITELATLTGGVDAWRKAGLPLVDERR